MAGNKTHEQQLRIIEKRVDTSNADKDFDPRPDLEAAEKGGGRVEETPEAEREPLTPADGSPGPRGLNQESQHHKNRGTPKDQK
ncbi:hypothetical protein SAMN05421641_1303 [Paracoccus thiocyanatus]|uniref:Uncharacterized protein n=1 Tax=Paracoccus thiocyanatus TaxID=34006 RepID=A0A1N6YZ33_9RHOB|nr:hypothetical protein [Paracoccus thiocyanatus]SIR19769.1 hypothetical protein SAMN05421641_1303 [Paracoccus thiocyanatus]